MGLQSAVSTPESESSGNTKAKREDVHCRVGRADLAKGELCSNRQTLFLERKREVAGRFCLRIGGRQLLDAVVIDADPLDLAKLLLGHPLELAGVRDLLHHC
jgi:hypothetical protein